MENKLIQFNNAENSPELSFQTSCPKLFTESMFVNSNTRDSLDNNPFDRALKELRLKDDPFEINVKRDTSSTKNHKNVQLAKLIDFGTDQMATILEDHNAVQKEEEPVVEVKTEPIEITSHSGCSSKVLNYALINHQNLKAIRSPFFGKKVAATATIPPQSRIKSDPGALPESPSSMQNKWCQYREPNSSLNTSNIKTDFKKLMETDGMSFSEEAHKITNRLMCSHALKDSLGWTAWDNSSFEDLQNTKPPKFVDTDISDLERELADLKIPMLDEIKHIEANQKLEEEKENDKKTLLSSYNTLKHNAEIQQLQLEQETVDSAMKTQAMVDVRRFKEILLKHKSSELSKNELLDEIEKAFEIEVGPPKPQRQLTFDVVHADDGDEEEDSTICENTVLEQTVVEANQASELEAKLQIQMKALLKTAMELNSLNLEPNLKLDLSTMLPGSKHRQSVVSSTPNMPSVVKSSRLSVNPTTRGPTISPMLKKHARMTIKPPIQRPHPAAAPSRPVKLKTSPIRALAPTKRSNPPMIAVHPVPRSRSSTCTPALNNSTVGTPAGGKRVSYAMTPKAARTTHPDGVGGGRRRSLTAGATPKMDQLRPDIAQKLTGKLLTTPSKMPYQTIGTPASRKSVLAATQPPATPSRRSMLPSQSGPRNLMNQMTPKPIRKLTSTVYSKN